jgi:hypothetical protein
VASYFEVNLSIRDSSDAEQEAPGFPAFKVSSPGTAGIRDGVAYLRIEGGTG